MRGDSRRDFYAKALALCGLGVLGGFGAVVDYWPVAIRFPGAEAPLTRDVPPTPAVPGDAWERVEQAAAMLAPAAAPTASRTTRRDTGAPVAVAAAALPSSIDLVRPVAALDTGHAAMQRLDAPLPAHLPVIATNRPPSVPAAVVTRLDVPSPAASAPAPSGAVAADIADGGMFGSAMRVTGRSLARSGAATGSSVAGAVRFVGGVFRRALPD